MKIKSSLIILIIIGFIVVSGAAFVVDETQQVVITQFGKSVREPITEPGIYFKIPLVQQANYFRKNLLEWDGEAGQIPTLDKTFIWVDTFARWKIVDPLKFFQSVNNEMAALARLDDIIDPAVRNAITSYPLIEAVRNSNREMDIFEVGLEGFERQPIPAIKVGKEKITQGILEQAKLKLAKFGIELVDVRIKRINYVEEVRRAVYQRMIAERNQIAEKFRSEGKGESQKIEGDREKELLRITSKAYKKAQEIKGKADAEATEIYAKAFNRDPEFYSFVNTLDIYKDTLGEDSTLLLGTDSDFFKYLKKYSKGK